MKIFQGVLLLFGSIFLLKSVEGQPDEEENRMYVNYEESLDEAPLLSPRNDLNSEDLSDEAPPLPPRRRLNGADLSDEAPPLPPRPRRRLNRANLSDEAPRITLDSDDSSDEERHWHPISFVRLSNEAPSVPSRIRLNRDNSSDEAQPLSIETLANRLKKKRPGNVYV